MSAPMELTMDLARELELAEAHAAVRCAESVKSVASAVEIIAGGYAVYCGAASPLTQAVALGLHGPVNVEAFDRLEAFYFGRHEPVRVETCPMADASLMTFFRERGYHVSEFSNVMTRPTGKQGKEVILPAGVAIRTVGPEEVDLWTLTVCRGFADSYPVTEELLGIMNMFALVQGTECCLASIDGQVAGGATLAVRGKIAGLFGASTLPEFRRRGVQTALLHWRLRRAAELGCRLAMSIALPGSISQRNITRVGFQTLYTRVKFERPLNGDASAGT